MAGKVKNQETTKTVKRTLITGALPYANGPLHLGYMVEAIQTDIFARFLRLRGEKVIFCCADDTHGTPIEINAAKQGKKPEEFIREYFEEHTETLKRYLIRHDSYYTTHSSENKFYSELIFSRLKEKGLIYNKEIELSYCSHCRRFLPDRYVKGVCPKCGAEDQYGDVCEKCNSTYATTDLVRPYCVVCRNTPERRTSRHYFFKLSECSGQLKSWLEGNESIQPEIRNFVMSWI
ncbi:methionine--tRNA ligase, partial [Candidatus Woesearchaeota archaeon CG_4_10_14_0_8_um_filter_47_5]